MVTLSSVDKNNNMLAYSTARKISCQNKSHNTQDTTATKPCLKINYSELSDMSYSLTMASASFDSSEGEEKTNYNFSQASNSLIAATTLVSLSDSTTAEELWAPSEIVFETRQDDEPKPKAVQKQPRSMPLKASSSPKATSRVVCEPCVKQTNNTKGKKNDRNNIWIKSNKKLTKKASLKSLKTPSPLPTASKNKKQEGQKRHPSKAVSDDLPKDCVKTCSNKSNNNKLNTSNTSSKSLQAPSTNLSPKKQQQKQQQRLQKEEKKYHNLHQVADSYATKLENLMNEYHRELKVVEKGEKESPQPVPFTNSKKKLPNNTKSKTSSKTKHNQEQQSRRRNSYNNHYASSKAKNQLSWWDETASLFGF